MWQRLVGSSTYHSCFATYLSCLPTPPHPYLRRYTPRPWLSELQDVVPELTGKNNFPEDAGDVAVRGVSSSGQQRGLGGRWLVYVRV